MARVRRNYTSEIYPARRDRDLRRSAGGAARVLPSVYKYGVGGRGRSWYRIGAAAAYIRSAPPVRPRSFRVIRRGASAARGLYISRDLVYLLGKVARYGGADSRTSYFPNQAAVLAGRQVIADDGPGLPAAGAPNPSIVPAALSYVDIPPFVLLPAAQLPHGGDESMRLEARAPIRPPENSKNRGNKILRIVSLALPTYRADRQRQKTTPCGAAIAPPFR